MNLYGNDRVLGLNVQKLRSKSMPNMHLNFFEVTSWNQDRGKGEVWCIGLRATVHTDLKL